MNVVLITALVKLASVVVEQIMKATQGEDVSVDELEAQSGKIRAIVDDWKQFRDAKKAEIAAAEPSTAVEEGAEG